MNRMLLLLLLIVGISTVSFSQNCNPATVAQLPGTWKAGMKNPAGSADAATIAKAKKNIEAFHNAIRLKYSPVGLQAMYSISSVSKDRDLEIYSYGYSLGIHPFYCDKNVVKSTHEGVGGLIMKVNPGNFFGGWSGYMGEQDHLIYGYIDRMPAQKDGIWDLGEIDYTGGFSRPLKKQIYLVTYQNQLPFQYVSRLEFLQKKKAGVQKEKEEGIVSIKNSFPVRPKAEQDKEKVEAVKKIKEDAAKGKGWGDWSDKYLKDYKTDEQKQNDAISKTNEFYDEQLRKLDEHLRLPEKELQQPAIVFSYQEFRGFLKEGEAGASILVKENKAYYDRKLPKNASQLFFIQFIYDHNDPVSTKAFKDVQKAIDFTLLKNMIGK